ncbi:MAG: MBL fold metallo-hydrolase [Pseudomonadales bacterium]|nr:MBL fold metallo-hydrolase [Pseudomonadales bacterium]
MAVSDEDKALAGRLTRISPLVWRLTAPNAGIMTGPGTNTYIVGSKKVAVIDPGPDNPEHHAAIKKMLSDNGLELGWIMPTHTHMDHSPLATTLKNNIGGQLAGMRAPDIITQDQTFVPDINLQHGDTITADDFTLEVIHTPGHASNHLCFLLKEEQLLFTGDHIMEGSTVVIGPPDGNMKAYLASLELLHDYALEQIAPAHGDLLSHPHKVADSIIQHRLKRENKAKAALTQLGSGALDQLVPIAYDDVDPRLYPVAAFSLKAHLDKLVEDGFAGVELITEEAKEVAIWKLVG